MYRQQKYNPRRTTVRVTPYWQTKRNFFVHTWPYLMGATAGLYLGSTRNFTQNKEWCY